MEDNGYFIKTLFRKHSLLNVSALLISVLGPAIATMLAGSFVGSQGLAVIAICAPLFLAASFFGFTIAGGGQIVCSAFVAKDSPEDVNEVFNASLFLMLAMAVITIVMMSVFKEPLLLFLAGEITRDLSAFYDFYLPYVFFSMLIYVPLYFSKTAGRVGVGLVLMASMAAVSSISGMLFVRTMGIEGIALGLSMGSFVGFVVGMGLLSKHYKIKLPRQLYVKRIFVSGSPAGLSRLYIFIVTITLNTMFLRAGGIDALAVFGVVSVIHRFALAVIVGIVQTILPLIGVFQEEQDYTSIRQTMKLAFVSGNIVMTVFGALIVLFNPFWSVAFGLPAGGGLTFVMIFYTAYLVMLFNGALLSAYYNASKRIALANAIPFLQEFATIGITAVVLGSALGLVGIWAAFPVSGAVSLMALFVYLLVARGKELSVPLLQNRAVEAEGRFMSFSVESGINKASEASVKTNDYCLKHGIPSKQSMLISMSVEEIVTLIINNNKTKNLSVSVRLVLFSDRIVLRIRNTGERFDVIEYYGSNIACDSEKSLEVIGMKYIVQAARNIYYRRTFGVNSLVVVI